MKTRLHSNNPFKHTRYGFAFENIQDGCKCLDYGCYDGAFIKRVMDNKKVQYTGIDKNKDMVAENPYDLDLWYFENQLPFDDKNFDFVSMLDVLEHISDKDEVLSEINRVLKKDGIFVVTVPKRNIFSFMDLGNLKFVFPKLHKFFYIMMHGREEYEYRYVNNPHGLVGDVEKELGWHQHFSEKELSELLEKNGFMPVLFDGSALFHRFLMLFKLVKLGFLVPDFIIDWDARMFESSNLFCKAVKTREK